MELSTYFRINQAEQVSLRRTLLIADEGSQVSYLKVHCSMRDENQLHAAVVELIALDKFELNTQPFKIGTRETSRKGGVFNFVTKRGICYKMLKFLGLK